jgi:hypothetical protein
MQTTTIIGLDIARPVFQLHRVQVLLPKPSRAHSMDFWGRTGSRSVVMPYVFVEVNSRSF